MKNWAILVVAVISFGIGYFVHSPMNETVDIKDKDVYPQNIVMDNTVRSSTSGGWHSTPNMTDMYVSMPAPIEQTPVVEEEPIEQPNTEPMKPIYDSGNDYTMVFLGGGVGLLILWLFYDSYKKRKQKVTKRSSSNESKT